MLAEHLAGKPTFEADDVVALYRSPDRDSRHQRSRRRRAFAKTTERAMHCRNEARELIDADSILHDVATDDPRTQAAINRLRGTFFNHIFYPSVRAGVYVVEIGSFDNLPNTKYLRLLAKIRGKQRSRSRQFSKLMRQAELPRAARNSSRRASRSPVNTRAIEKTEALNPPTLDASFSVASGFPRPHVNCMTDRNTKMGGSVVVPGHERTITTLGNIVAEYRAACFDSSGKYSFDQKRQDAAVTNIMALSQFYTHSDAIQMLGRAVTSPPRPAPASKPPRSKPKPP